MGRVREREVDEVEWDLGLRGVGMLLVMSLGLGLIVQLVSGEARTRWLWLYTSVLAFIGGLFTSEVWFGWATEEELQPNIDGLSFDEVLLFHIVFGVVVVVVARFLARRRLSQSDETADAPIDASIETKSKVG